MNGLSSGCSCVVDILISINFDFILISEIPDDLIEQLAELNGNVGELKIWKEDVDVRITLSCNFPLKS